MPARILVGAMVFATVIALFTGCPHIFTEDLDSPMDPEADSYEGFDTVDNPDDLQIHSNSRNGLVFLAPFILSRVNGAEAYGMQIASSPSFESGSVLYEGHDFTSNTIEADPELQIDTVYWWRARAYKGTWGNYCTAVSFTKGRPAGLSPANGGRVKERSPRLSWDSIPGAVRYHVQAAQTDMEVASAPVVEVASNTYTWPTQLAEYDELYWRIRAVNAANTTSVWSHIVRLTVVPPYVIGETGPAGGVVFYDNGSYSQGWRFLEAAPNDQGRGNVWGGWGTSVGGTAESLGSGASNTERITAALGAAEPYSGRTNYAAKVCAELVSGGYGDWFLPSREELHQMYQQRHLIGGFAPDTDYWSSSEYQIDGHLFSWQQNLTSGGQGGSNKNASSVAVRAIRAF